MPARTTCTVTGCSRKVHAKGLCRPHYQQNLRHQPLRPVREGPARETVGVRFAPDVRQALEELSERRGCTASDLVREAVREWLERQP